MNQISLHRDAGLRIFETERNESLYSQSLEQAAEDSEMALSWPEPTILRIFPLVDGRMTIVRETPYGLNQEAAPANVQLFHQSLLEKVELLIQKEAERMAAANENSEEV